MFEALLNCWRIPELKRRLMFTAGMLAIFRLCAVITVPGVDSTVLAEFFRNQAGTLFGMVDMFSGGAFLQMSIVALGIMPYISASIIMQLLTSVVPYLEKLSKEGEAGRRQITKYTRYATVLLAAIQGSGLSIWMRNMRTSSGTVVPEQIPAFVFHFVTVVTLVTGTIFLMWLGEQITERGIGNGISLLIFVGIMARLPSAVIDTFKAVFQLDQMSIFTLIILGALILLVVAAVVTVQQGQRRIPIRYAKQVRGRKMYGGQSTHLPLKVDYAGVIAVIFGSALLMFPATIIKFFAGDSQSKFALMMVDIADQFQRGTLLWGISFFALIIFFCYFYTAITFNPADIAENLRKHGGFIPGRRPGKPTADYIEWVMTRITLVGAVFVGILALLPTILINKLEVPFYFGGTSLLIVVGVALDTLSQMESHLVVRHYDSFMRTGRIKGRRG